jgi:hypothetical protein
MAVNCWLRPLPTFTVGGATTVVISTTFKARLPITEGLEVKVAVTVADPAAAGPT